MKKAAALFLLFILFTPQNIYSAEASSFEDVREELRENDKKIHEMEEERREIHQSIDGIGEEMEALILKMAELSRDIEEKKVNISSISREILLKEEELKEMKQNISLIEDEMDALKEVLTEKEERLQEIQEIMGKRIRSAYKNRSGHNLFFILVESEGLLDLFERMKFLKIVVDRDRYLMDEIEKEKKSIEKSRSELEEKRRELLINISHIENQKGRLQDDQYRLQRYELELQDQYEQASRLEEEKRNLLSSMNEREREISQNVGDIMLRNEYLEKELQRLFDNMSEDFDFNASDQQFIRPTAGRLTSPFGYRIHPIWKDRRFHNGIDLAAPQGTPVFAAKDGVVINSSYLNSYGNLVIINHGDGYTSYYAHLSRFNCNVGDVVRQGQKIGEMGNTGDSTGPHLHFEIRKDKEPQNPLKYID